MLNFCYIYLFQRGVKNHPPHLLWRTIVLRNKFITLENKHQCETFHYLGGCSLTNTFLIVWFIISLCRFFISKAGLTKFYKSATKIPYYLQNFVNSILSKTFPPRTVIALLDNFMFQEN